VEWFKIYILKLLGNSPLVVPIFFEGRLGFRKCIPVIIQRTNWVCGSADIALFGQVYWIQI